MPARPCRPPCTPRSCSGSRWAGRRPVRQCASHHLTQHFPEIGQLTLPKDKAVKRFNIRDIVDASSKKDLEENRAFDTYIIPKLYIKMQYCVGCAIHARIVKVRGGEERRSRAPPQRIQRDATGKIIKAPVAK